MKKFKKIIAGLLLAAMCLFAICGCSNKPANDETTEPKEITICFFNGESKLGEIKVEEGKLIDASVYAAFENQENYEFTGWYETPTFLESSKKDLKTATFTEDTELYGCFQSTDVVKDERLWYIVGTSKVGTLAESNWAAAVDDSVKEKFLMQPTGKTNEFSITIDLYEGDQFQVIHDWAWEEQHGYGYFKDVDTTWMENGGGLGGTDITSNANVIMSGNYTITLTTDPENSLMDAVTVVRNGDPVNAGAEEKETEPFACTDLTSVKIKGSWVDDWSELLDMTRTEGTTEFVITKELKAGTEVCLMIFEDGADTGLVLKECNVTDEASLGFLSDNGNNIQVAEDGTYTITANLENMTVTVSK